MSGLARDLKVMFSQKNSVLKRWLISYLLVLIIPLLAIVTTFYSARNIITDVIAGSNGMTLSAIQATIDNRIEQSKQIASNLMLDKRFRDVTRKGNTPQDIVETQQYLIQLLFNYSSTSSWLDILLYVPQWDYMVTPQTAQPLSTLQRSVLYANRAQMDADTWRSLLTASGESFGFVSSPFLSYSKYGEGALVYCLGTSKSIYNNYQHTCIFISLQYSGMQEILDIPEGGAVLLLDSSGAVLASFGKSFPGLALPGPEAGSQSLTHEGVSYIHTQKQSHAANITYAMLIPSSDYWRSANYITLASAAALVAALLVGLITSLALLRRNYQPVKSVMDILKTAEPGASSQNEFDLIRTHLIDLADSRSTMESSLARQQHLFREAFLYAVLMGNRRHLSDDDLMESLQLDMDEALFIPLSIFIVNPQAPGEGADLPVAFLIDNILGELLTDAYDRYKVELHNTITFVFALRPDQADAFAAAVQAALAQLNAVFEEHFQLMLRAVVGRSAATLEELTASYKEIMDVHIYQYASTDSRILHVDQLDFRAERSMPRVEEYAAMLAEAVLYKKTEDALYITDLFFGELQAAGEPFGTARYHVFALVDRLTGVMQHAGDLPAAELTGALDAVAAGMTQAEQKRALTELIYLLCGKDAPRQAQESSVSMQITAFIQARYADQNLSLTMIADHVGLSAKYISKLFKMETGDGLLHYINTVRVQNAKRILAQGGVSINDVAEQVGYTNQKTFRRAFHKVEGINPSEYRV